jgi:hypothetical protein
MAAARKLLEEALQLNPTYHPAWQYFLRLLQLTKATDGPRWAQEARRLFPEDFALALLAVRLYGPQQVITQLQRLIDEFAPQGSAATAMPRQADMSSPAPAAATARAGLRLAAHELPAATAALSSTLAEIAPPLLGQAEMIGLLRSASSAFAHSAALLDLLGHALYLSGQTEESRAAFCRALQLRETALGYQAEFPRETGAVHYWQFARQIERAG